MRSSTHREGWFWEIEEEEIQRQGEASFLQQRSRTPQKGICGGDKRHRCYSVLRGVEEETRSRRQRKLLSVSIGGDPPNSLILDEEASVSKAIVGYELRLDRERQRQRDVIDADDVSGHSPTRLSHLAILVVAIDPPSPKEKLNPPEKAGYEILKQKKAGFWRKLGLGGLN
ncbi:unnamed protein product [Linum tenue]|uniref:Uncharacterized protein n=1 Tax=Linum tenue TaxID=586396 RepID=A0AAV0KVR6_9ROSI|nr:unnamed protein product [Linum tenue]CAI0426292.1 unnamed protein product [Linum tenue]